MSSKTLDCMEQYELEVKSITLIITESRSPSFSKSCKWWRYAITDIFAVVILYCILDTSLAVVPEHDSRKY